jgi:hypothetical protein
MSIVTTNIEFTEMKKNKKESLKFTLKGDDANGTGKQLYDMAGSIVHMEIKGCAVGKFPAEFVDIKKSAKGVVANFLLKGDLSDEKSGLIYAYSGGRNVELSLEETQMSIEDFHDDEHDGIEYTVNLDGTINADKDQLNMEEVAAGSEAGASQETEEPGEPKDPAGDNVSDLGRARAKRVTKAEKEAEAARLAAEAAAAAGGSKQIKPLDDDDQLPF